MVEPARPIFTYSLETMKRDMHFVIIVFISCFVSNIFAISESYFEISDEAKFSALYDIYTVICLN